MQNFLLVKEKLLLYLTILFASDSFKIKIESGNIQYLTPIILNYETIVYHLFLPID
jgi:hypothetical protein